MTDVADERMDWSRVELPDSWPDRLHFGNPSHLWRFVRAVLARERQPVRLPADLPGAAEIPRYVLQEFHNLPNGNYSNNVARGYAQGFDAVMLGTLQHTRARLAGLLAPARDALDVGCGSGHMAAALYRAGVGRVLGIDPSPYLLQAAARRYPEIGFEQGVAETLPFASGSFDAVAACFVFHEIPPRFAERAIREIRRVLRPGGRLGLIEPSALQRSLGKRELLRRFGWRGLYFRMLARAVYEPFLEGWHRRELHAWLREAGFAVRIDDESVPCRIVVAERSAETLPEY